MKLWVLLAQATGLTPGRQTLLPAGKHSPRRQAGAGTRAVFSRGAGRRCCRVDLAWSPAAFRGSRTPENGRFPALDCPRVPWWCCCPGRAPHRPENVRAEWGSPRPLGSCVSRTISACVSWAALWGAEQAHLWELAPPGWGGESMSRVQHFHKCPLHPPSKSRT